MSDLSHRSPARRPAFACLYAPPQPAGHGSAGKDVASPVPGDLHRPTALLEIAQAFSPRYERVAGNDGPADVDHESRGHTVVVDVSGLERLMRSRAVRSTDESAPPPIARVDEDAETWRTIGHELVRAAAETSRRVQVAIAGTRVAALVLAHARPGLTVVPPGREAAALASVPLDVLAQVVDMVMPSRARTSRARTSAESAIPSEGRLRVTQGDGAAKVGVAIFKQWALRTLGDVAALPAADLVARLGRPALIWQAIARGEDIRPLVPTEPEERFEQSLELEWPIEGLEPLSFVLTRLLEPLSTQLERRDRSAAVVHVLLDLVSREVHARHLQLPSPLRDVRTLRTLVLLDIEAHPPASAIDRVTIAIDPTPGRIVQHTLFTRALPTPERLSTLLARLGAVLGADRVGAPVGPAGLDTHRPGAFAMAPFAIDRPEAIDPRVGTRDSRSAVALQDPASTLAPADWRLSDPIVALRRCRQPVPARVVVEAGRPVRVTSERRGYAGGGVIAAAGPWRTSGHWWEERSSTIPAATGPWDRDEWEVALSDRVRYRVFRDRTSDAWFIEGIFD